MSDWAATKDIQGIQFKVRVPAKAVARLMQVVDGGVLGVELEDIAKALVWGWDRPEDCNWPAMDVWLSTDLDRLAEFEAFVEEVALDFFFKRRDSNERTLARREDLKAALQLLQNNGQTPSDASENETAKSETTPLT